MTILRNQRYESDSNLVDLDSLCGHFGPQLDAWHGHTQTEVAVEKWIQGRIYRTGPCSGP